MPKPVPLPELYRTMFERFAEHLAELAATVSVHTHPYKSRVIGYKTDRPWICSKS
ncbi:hypothetical protein [Saccharopolyspora griseoalba]|uniref:Uncharacterized protein n=1 Tax=Saccharopolyspora griseoalba TaxID=1431848 RepID=A0ABW2LQQ0_9PSEU